MMVLLWKNTAIANNNNNNNNILFLFLRNICVDLVIWMRLLECLELGAALDDPGNGRIFCHVDLEANGVVDLGNEANVCQRDAIPDAEFSAGLLQFLLECFLLDVSSPSSSPS